MWTCQEGLVLTQHTRWEFPGSVSPPLPAHPPCGLSPAMEAPGQEMAMALAWLSWSRCCCPEQGTLLQQEREGWEESGWEVARCEERIKLVLRQNRDWRSCAKDQFGWRDPELMGQGQGRALGWQSAPSDQGPEHVPHSSKTHLVWWRLLGRQ